VSLQSMHVEHVSDRPGVCSRVCVCGHTYITLHRTENHNFAPFVASCCGVKACTTRSTSSSNDLCSSCGVLMAKSRTNCSSPHSTM